jgi:hypothetical protein
MHGGWIGLGRCGGFDPKKNRFQETGVIRKNRACFVLGRRKSRPWTMGMGQSASETSFQGGSPLRRRHTFILCFGGLYVNNVFCIKQVILT